MTCVDEIAEVSAIRSANAAVNWVVTGRMDWRAIKSR